MALLTREPRAVPFGAGRLEESSRAALIDTSLHFLVRSDGEASAKPQGSFPAFEDCLIVRSFSGETGLEDAQMCRWLKS
jgi:hypothetical protein